ncbi:MAG: TIGR02757 family protein [Bacteroidia bacterium]|nr:TIGR02757 family protein [Bacteroidia bacterium]
MTKKEIKKLLDIKVEQFNNPEFLLNDPVGIPHRFTVLQDIEIMGFFAAILAWGQRITIINNCNKLINLFDGNPYEFILNHKSKDLKRFKGFAHRTFNEDDLLYVIDFFKRYYNSNLSLENAFSKDVKPKDTDVGNGLAGFRNLFTDCDYFPHRTGKHVASPVAGSACKRLNMYLRWMVRKDEAGVDFGLWTKIKPSQLVCPLDVHVQRVALKLGLLKSEKSNWETAVQLTNELKKFDPIDPVKYDFALFGIGVEGSLD